MSSTLTPSTSWISLTTRSTNSGGAEFDHELIKSLTFGAVQDVDGHDVAAHGADAAGHLAQGPRAVRQPDSQDVAAHDPDHNRTV